MKILQINVIYGHGSTGKIVQALHEEYMRQGHDSHVFFGRGPKGDDKRIVRIGFLWEAKLWRFIQLFTGNHLGGSPLSTWNLKRHIKKLNPDVVHVHLINGNMCNVFSLMKWLRKQGYKVVLTHHAKLMFTGGCGINLCDKYQSGCGDCPLKKEVFGFAPDCSRHTNRKLASLGLDKTWIRHSYVSPWLLFLAERSSILENADNHAVCNPVDIAIFNPDGRLDKPLRDRPYVFFPTSVHNEVKGWQWIEAVGARLKELGLDLLVTGSGNERFDSSSIIDVGHISDQKLLASYYRQAKVTIVLSKFESFSMPTAESLCCGTPVCGFKAGGPESIAPEDYGAVDNGDIDQLILEIKRSMDVDRSSIANKAMDKFSTAHIAEEFLHLY
ncbi:MAG: glycosyltransferase [Bacilli bacterium]|nr:glycosyltransferase [Bacilli bacterium]